MNPIAAAVEPLRVEAVQKAREFAEARIAWFYEKLAEANWDINAVFPYPSSLRLGRNEFIAQKANYEVARRLTANDANAPGQKYGNNMMRGPDFRVESPEGAAAFIKRVEEDANFQYDAFIAKMVKKVGPVEGAELRGNHVWGYSFLHVVKAGEVKEVWKTQQIVNVSKLGNVFNQWPSRKMK